MDMHLGNPIVRGALTLHPVFNGEAVAQRRYVLHGSAVTVAERAGRPLVGELVVSNGGVHPVLVLEGELIEGGRQHRVAARSLVIEPGESRVIEVRCVEQGRWAGTDAHDRRGRRAPLTVRAAADQGAVWDRVGRYGTSATGSLLETTRDRDAAAAALVSDLRPLPFQTGVLVGIGGQPLAMEVFDSPETLAEVWDAIVHAAAVDAVGAPAVATPGRRARRFAGMAAAAAVRPGRTSPHARVTVLHWRGRAVQTVAVNPRHGLVAA